MPNTHRWIEITPSEYAWEREALDYLKARLPDGDPFRAWSNFEFIAHDGSINEVDLLVVSLHSVYLVEIKSWRGVVEGDQGTWQRTVDRKKFLVDSPLLLTNRKARKLATLLREQPALAKERKPFLEPVVFLSRARCRLEGPARTGVYLPAESAADGGSNIVDVLSGQSRVRSPPAAAAHRPAAGTGVRTRDGAGRYPPVSAAEASFGLRAAPTPAGDGRLPGLGSRARRRGVVEAPYSHLSARAHFIGDRADGAARCRRARVSPARRSGTRWYPTRGAPY